LDDEILKDPEILKAIENGTSIERSFDIVNTDRAVLGRVAGAIAKKWGDKNFPG